MSEQVHKGANDSIRTTSGSSDHTHGKWMFLIAFLFSCFLFWWIRSILVRVFFRIPDPVEDSTIAISILAAMAFVFGYLLPVHRQSRSLLPDQMLNRCGDFAYASAQFLFVPALLIAFLVFRSRVGIGYGSAGAIPSAFQALLYTHLFVGFMSIGSADPQKQGWRRRVVISIALISIPRLIISLLGARFILVQAIAPVVLIAFARDWIRLSWKRVFQVLLLIIAIVFVPAMTRGSQVIGTGGDFALIMGSDILGLFQNNLDMSLDENCPPLLISLTAKTIPYGSFHLCVVDSGGLKDMPATLERILTNNEPGSFQGTTAGTGSNYLLELYVSGGLFAVYFGSALFGITCRSFVKWIGNRSLFSGIWVECLTRALLAPRGNLGYVFERIPSLIAATLAVIVIVWAWRLIDCEPACRPIS